MGLQNPDPQFKSGCRLQKISVQKNGDFFIHCESNGISLTTARRCRISSVRQDCISSRFSVHQKAFAMMIYKTLFWWYAMLCIDDIQFPMELIKHGLLIFLLIYSMFFSREVILCRKIICWFIQNSLPQILSCSAKISKHLQILCFKYEKAQAVFMQISESMIW